MEDALSADLEGCRYWLMDGIGNAFIIVDLRGGGTLGEDAARGLAEAAEGVRIDQVIGLVAEGEGAAMTIFNRDGSVAGACGNAARCIAWRLMEEQGTDEVIFGTPAGSVTATRAGDHRVTVDMGAPRLGWQDIPLAEACEDTRFLDIKVGPIDNPVLWGPSAVSMGNPHCVFFVEDVAAQRLDRFGPLIENHPLFPEGANVSVAEVPDPHHIRLRTWERGAGLTQACGTAACAALVSAVRRRRTGRRADVTLPGGTLDISWREADDHVLMTGDIRALRTGRL
ncbi:diaminopimelate epimerase [Parvularcula bermudensis HTCC2503]|uniref:Diaminopimelate epimerase n=1 Tax=Parvularcula bermudensis (strain ATCC BAA-594 / HTCC2503 / KCTC 12087) TaxID=314260 RepID=E0TEK5_PARBH|nr:diaminopimelate epimerase [Parvularcula bermudensis]ADM08888.1 diaminopimelate epimerase [Parvularcula bermudensis HTCC2503]